MHEPGFSLTDIRAAVAEELGATVAEIDDHENLIALGMDSMQLMRLAAAWRQRGADIGFPALAADPTVHAWHRLLSADPGEQQRDHARTRAQAAHPADTEEAARASAGKKFPLATMQHGYWIGRDPGQVLGGVSAHLYAELDGNITDPERMRHAVEATVRRHASLRTRIHDDGTQEVLEWPEKPFFSALDLRDEPPASVSAQLQRLRDEGTHRMLDIRAGQMLHVALTLLPEGRSRLHIDVDMIAADAMSYRTILADMAHAAAGGQPEPRALEYDYERYLREHGALTAEAREREAGWWAQQLRSAPEPPALPVRSEREAADPHRSIRLAHVLRPAQRHALYERSKRHGLTPAMVLATAFADVIARWSREHRFLLNLPLFDREPLHPDVEHLVGDFSNSVLLDTDVRPERSFAERARRMQEHLHERAAHAAYRGLDVLRDLGRARGEPVIAPIVYTSGLNLGDLFAPSVTERLGRPSWIISQGPQVLLDAQVVELDGGILLNWDMRRDLFLPGVAEHMFDAYRSLITGIIADDADWSRAFALPLPAPQRERREAVNDTACGDIAPRTLHAAFFQLARDVPDAPAVLWGHEERWSYAELAERALRIAGALRERGIARGGTVAIMLPRGAEQIAAVLGVLAAGAAYLPIGTDQPAARRDAILRKGRASVLLTAEPHGKAAAPPQGVQLAEITRALQHPPLPEPAETGAHDIAYVLFTSGSTGEPKGVEITHAAAANTIDAVTRVFGITRDDRTLGISRLEFDLSVMDIFAPLALGGACIAVSEQEEKDALAWARLMERHGASALTCAPGVLRMLLDAAQPQQLRSLRIAMLGGDWVTADLPQRLRELAPRARFAGLGGATETAIHCTAYEVSGDLPPGWDVVPYGRPLPNFRCRVVNPAGADCPDFVTGELWIGGPSIALGYRGEPELTAERFIQDGETRWYRSGDLARYLPDGTLEFLGRADHQVKIRGHRIELGEVEAALRGLGGVQVAVAVTSGDAEPVLMAAVTGEQLREEALLRQVARLLPPYMLPKRIMPLAAMPFTDNGKVDRRRVRELLERDAHAPASAAQAPRNAVEAALLHIIAEVLPGPLHGIDTDFFEAGGDSVLATTAVARIRRLLHIDALTAASFFTARNVRELAHALREREDPARLEAVASIYREVAQEAAAGKESGSPGQLGGA